MNIVTTKIAQACEAIIAGYAADKSGLDDDMIQHLIDLADEAETILELIGARKPAKPAKPAKPKAPAVETLHAECARGSQSVDYVETFAIAGRKFRVRIHCDTSYANQSHIYAEALDVDALKWNRIADIHYSRMQTQSPGYDGRLIAMPTPATFKRDRDALISQVCALLS